MKKLLLGITLLLLSFQNSHGVDTLVGSNWCKYDLNVVEEPEFASFQGNIANGEKSYFACVGLSDTDNQYGGVSIIESNGTPIVDYNIILPTTPYTGGTPPFKFNDIGFIDINNTYVLLFARIGTTVTGNDFGYSLVRINKLNNSYTILYNASDFDTFSYNWTFDNDYIYFRTLEGAFYTGHRISKIDGSYDNVLYSDWVNSLSFVSSNLNWLNDLKTKVGYSFPNFNRIYDFDGISMSRTDISSLGASTPRTLFYDDSDGTIYYSEGYNTYDLGTTFISTNYTRNVFNGKFYQIPDFYSGSILSEENYAISFVYKDNSSLYYNALNGDLYLADSTYTLGGDLTVSNYGSVIMTASGVTISGITTNKDFYLQYTITDTNTLETYFSSSTTVYAGGTHNIDIPHGVDYFNSLGGYDINMTFIDFDNPLVNYYHVHSFQYFYDSGPVEYQISDFAFRVSGITFLENGFYLNNFYEYGVGGGGNLYFEIKAPNPAGTGTVDITTQIYPPGQYGFDVITRVTYPYHQTPGTYQVRAVYDYDGLIIYPFGTDYNSYVITLTESPAVWEEDMNFDACDTNLDGFVDVGEQYGCLNEVGFWQALYDFFNIFPEIYNVYTSIKDFFKALMNIGTTDTREWSFIPSANASVIGDGFVDLGNGNNGFLNSMGDLFKGFVLILILTISLVLIIIMRR